MVVTSCWEDLPVKTTVGVLRSAPWKREELHGRGKATGEAGWRGAAVPLHAAVSGGEAGHAMQPTWGGGLVGLQAWVGHGGALAKIIKYFLIGPPIILCTEESCSSAAGSSVTFSNNFALH